ncbi:MAG: ParB N-terminal domain-containing protein [Pirellulales bacterium]
MKIRDRIKELKRVPANELRPNPKNWRTHPQQQSDALKGVLSEVGFADACIARELEDGTLLLLDGHLRAETSGTEIVPVLVLDVDEAEGDKILATLDPLASMADSNAETLDELLRNVNTSSEALNQLIASTAEQAGLYTKIDGPTAEEDKEAPEDFKEFDEDIETDKECPKCGYKWA